MPSAMLIAAGFGIFMLGLFTTGAEISEGLKSRLEDWQWGQGVGPLSGKTTVASTFYFGCLALMWFVWRQKDVDLKKTSYVG